MAMQMSALNKLNLKRIISKYFSSDHLLNCSSMLTWLEGIKTRSTTFLKCDKVIMNLNLKERQRFKYKNYIEAALCAMIIDNFKQCGVSPKSISVITPFLD